MSDEQHGVSPKELLTVAQIETEYKIHRSTFYRHARERGIRPYRRPGDRHSYFERREVADLFEPRQSGDRQ